MLSLVDSRVGVTIGLVSLDNFETLDVLVLSAACSHVTALHVPHFELHNFILSAKHAIEGLRIGTGIRWRLKAI